MLRSIPGTVLPTVEKILQASDSVVYVYAGAVYV